MEWWHRQQTLLTPCKVSGLIHMAKLGFPQEDYITLIPNRATLSLCPGKSLYQSCHFSTVLRPYSISSLFCVDIPPGVFPHSGSGQVPVSGALPASAAPEVFLFPGLENVKSHILCLSLLLAEETPKQKSQNKTQKWWQERNLGRRPNIN